MSKFDVKQADLTVEARYDAPAFALLRPESQRVIELLLTQLAPYGANPDAVFYNDTGPLGNRNVTLNTPAINGGVKVFVAKAEAGFNDLSRVRFSDIQAIARSLFESIENVAAGTRFSAYTVSLNYHGLVEGTTVPKFIQQYVGNMPSLGPVNGAAAGFYYGQKGPRNFLSVVMDGSLAVPNALYIRIICGFDGKQLPHAQLPAVGAATLAEVLTAFKLEHELDLGQGK